MNTPSPRTTRQAASARQVTGAPALRLALACSLAAAFPIPAQADFGRLFFTAEQRHALDQPEPPAPPPPPPTAVERAATTPHHPPKPHHITPSKKSQSTLITSALP